jgi:hypothetical protein
MTAQTPTTPLIGYDGTDTYNPTTGTGTYQILWSKADGKFYFADGRGVMGDSGIAIDASTSFDKYYKFTNGASTLGGISASVIGSTSTVQVECSNASSTNNQLQLVVPGTNIVLFDSSIADPVRITGSTRITGGLSVGTTGAADGTIAATVTDAATTTDATVLTLGHNTSGTPGVNFGTTLLMTGESTTTPDRSIAALVSRWATATDASRKGRLDFFVYDTAARFAMRLETNGSAPMIGFLGAAAVSRPTVSGSRATDTWRQSVMAALVNLGLVTDSSTV